MRAWGPAGPRCCDWPAGRGPVPTPKRWSNAWWPVSRRASTPSGAASGPRRSSRGRRLVELCLRRARRGGSDAAHARQMGLRTLDAMAAGGIYDHLVGGFCRYSTDARWLVPHFEKMLTDQAQLARAYLHAWQDGGRAEYLGVVTETLDFVLRDLSTPEGALYSSFDADAGGVEGAHATFTVEELRRSSPPLSWRRRPSGTASPRAATGRALHPGPACRGATGAPTRGGGGPHPAGGGPGPAGPAGPGREGADGVECHDGGHPGRGGGRHRPGRLRPPRRGDRRIPLGLHVRRRTSDAELAGRAGAPSRRGGRLRLARRGLLPAVRVDGQGAVAGARRPRRSTSSSTCSGTTRRVASSHGQRRRSTRGPSEGVPRRCASRPPIPSPSPPCSTPAPWWTIRGWTRRSSARCAGRTPAGAPPGRAADMVAALPMWSGRNEIVVTGDRPDLLAEVRRNWLPAAVVAWGEPDGGPLFAGATARARTGLCLPGALVPGARAGRRYLGWPVGGADRMSGPSVDPRRTPTASVRRATGGRRAGHEGSQGARCGRGAGARRRPRSTEPRRRRRRNPRPNRPDPPSPALGPAQGPRPDRRGLHPAPARCPPRSRTPPSSTWPPGP